MSEHSRSQRRRTTATAGGDGLAEEALSPRSLAPGEPVEEAPGTPGEPDGFGTEDTRSAQNFGAIDSYSVPRDRTARLVEAALHIEGNGQASIFVNGVEYGPFDGATDVTIPFGRAFLGPGGGVTAGHQSTDGNNTTTKAVVVVQEV